MGIYVATSSWVISQDSVTPDGGTPFAYDSDKSFSPLIVTPYYRRATIRGLSVSCNGRQAGSDPLTVRTACSYLSIFGVDNASASTDRNSPSLFGQVAVTDNSWGFEWDWVGIPALWQTSLSPVAGLAALDFPESERPVVQAGLSYWVNVMVGDLSELVTVRTSVTYEV